MGSSKQGLDYKELTCKIGPITDIMFLLAQGSDSSDQTSVMNNINVKQ